MDLKEALKELEEKRIKLRRELDSLNTEIGIINGELKLIEYDVVQGQKIEFMYYGELKTGVVDEIENPHHILRVRLITTDGEIPKKHLYIYNTSDITKRYEI
jgi:hypothetical protein